MRILGIETSCDETSAAVIEIIGDKVKLITNIISSSLPLHSETGGIIPEVAAREQLKYIIPVIDKSLENISIDKIDKIAVTVGPGLIGSLLVGVETAKTIAMASNKPLTPVSHLYGHIYANWIDQRKEIKFPAIGLVVSGGHTDLVLMLDHKQVQWLGGTRDDAAGEAFDKIGRLLGLQYPAGPTIEKIASEEKVDFFNFPRPLINSSDFDFSFSGLKTAALREVEKIKKDKNNISENEISKICFSTQTAIFDAIIKKSINACIKYNAKSLVVGGGVAANQTLRQRFEKELSEDIDLFIPPKNLSTDNAAMIAAAGFFNSTEESWQNIDANPELYFD